MSHFTNYDLSLPVSRPLSKEHLRKADVYRKKRLEHLLDEKPDDDSEKHTTNEKESSGCDWRAQNLLTG